MNPGSIHRAMTLVEVLAATVILAALIVACMPWLSAVHHAAADRHEASSCAELSAFADGVVAQPESHGLEPLAAVESATLPWPGSEQTAREVGIRRMAVEGHEDQQRDHAWLAFESSGAIVLRWIKLPDREAAP